MPLPRLVVDNSSRHLPKKRQVHRKPAALALPVDLKMTIGREGVLGSPITDRLHRHAAKARDLRRAAKRVDNGGGGLQSIVSHAEQYSVSLKNVKGQCAESSARRAKRILQAMAELVEMAPRHLVGLRIKAAREALGRSQAEVCRALEIAPNKWNQWESGKYPPDPFVMARFADIYGVSLDWVYRGRADFITPLERSERTLERYNALLGMLAERAALRA